MAPLSILPSLKSVVLQLLLCAVSLEPTRLSDSELAQILFVMQAFSYLHKVADGWALTHQDDSYF